MIQSFPVSFILVRITYLIATEEAPIKKYALDIDKKGNARIKIATRTLMNKIDFKILIYPNGSAYINVNIQHCQSVIYLGKLDIKIEE